MIPVNSIRLIFNSHLFIGINKYLQQKNRVLLFFTLLACAFSTYSTEDINFSKIGIEQGLSQLSVMTIYQDELGNMWFGTREGLNIFNGTRMKVIQPGKSPGNLLSGNLIKEIDGDSQGSVFIHTQNGIDRYDLKTGYITQLVKMQTNAMKYANNRLWYAQENKIYRFNGDEEADLFAQVEKEVQITTILPLSDGRLFIGTVASGLYEIDRNKVTTKILDSCSRISSLYEDSEKNIWVSTWEEGLFRVGPNADIENFRQNIKNPSHGLSSDFVRSVCEDDNGDLWIGTKQGLNKFDRKQSLFYHHDSEAYDDRSLSNESVWSLYKDNYGNIWVGTYFGGVNYFNPKSNIYTPHNLRKGVYATKPFPIISAIIPYKAHTLFLCTEGDGLLLYNTVDKSYTEIASLKNENIKSAYYDKEDEQLYLGLHLGGLTVLDLKSRLLKRYSHIRPELDQSNIVRRILPYQDNYLIATYNGLYLFDKKKKTFTVFSEKLHQYVTYFVDIAIDNDNNLWVASRGVYRYNINTGETRSFFHDPNDEKSLSSNNATKLFLDSKGRLWIGTGGGGINLYDDKEEKFVDFTSENSQLKNNYVSNIEESPLGFIYLTTTQGLSYLDPEKKEVINFASYDGISLNSLFNGGITIQPDGEIYVAGMNGMVSFYEKSVLEDLRPIHLYFSGLWVNNREVLTKDDTRLLKVLLPYTEKLKFNYKQSILKFEFASDHIVAHNRYQYLYRVRGLSNEWIPLREGINEINLMILDAGRYRLELVAISPGSKAELGRAQIPFQITPPFYRSTFAYLLYIFIGLMLIGIYIRYIKYKVRLESSLEYEKKEKKHIEEVNQSKLRFFTNISHEFRTPLTLIASQVDMLMQNKKLQPAVLSRISSIARNTSLMKNLINELLDFRKIDNDKLSIKAGEEDIVAFLHTICSSFEEYAHDSHIAYSVQATDERIPVWFDQKQMQKVFLNLISNAFKYTPQGGKITVSLHQDSEKVSISVKDTGRGISPENREKVFDRFYQIDNEKGENNLSPGTGLGLALTKWIVDAHHGEIHLESELHKGSTFTVTLLKGSAHFTDNEKRVSETPDARTIHTIRHFKTEANADEEGKGKGKNHSGSRILIVEDNEELLNVLRSVFEPLYEVMTAHNGEEGLVKTIDFQPDIVLSDLMMPVMSGSEMCLKIKTNFAVCHIPVVLLTAQTAVESNIEGFKLGADDYITKPFDIAVLLARCNNLIQGRKLLQEKFAKSMNVDSTAIATNEIDRSFLEKVNRLIEQNMENPDFGVNEFSQGMNLGRTSLFQKIKGITGQTPNEYILTVKMKQATCLLVNHPELNISDVAYRLGFNTQKYFSKCFKNQFGITPSDFKNQNTTV